MQPELKQYVTEIMEDAYVLSLGVSDQDGPWVADVVYVHDADFTLYWISHPESRHSKAIEAHGVAACTIHASWAMDKERALQISGTAARVEVPLPEMHARLKAKEGTHVASSDAPRVDAEKVWYRLTPTRIELIHNEVFGYKRQRVL